MGSISRYWDFFYLEIYYFKCGKEGLGIKSGITLFSNLKKISFFRKEHLCKDDKVHAENPELQFFFVFSQ